MEPIKFTDDETGAVYGVRALTIGEKQTVINLTVSLLKAVAQLKGWDIDPDNAGQYSAYPLPIQTAAHEYITLWQTTVIDGTPSHPYPDSILDVIDPVLFEGWLKFLRQRPTLKNQWATIWNQTNGETSDPQPPSDDETPEPTL